MFIGMKVADNGEGVSILNNAINRRITRFSVILFIFLLVCSILFVRPGVWLNTSGVLRAPFGLIEILQDQFDDAPLSIYDPIFRGAHDEIATRFAMTNAGAYDLHKEVVKTVWLSFLDLIAIFMTILYTNTIVGIRRQSKKSSVPSVLGMWSCFAGAILFSDFTISYFNFINVPVMFILAGIGSTAIYLFSKEYSPPEDKPVINKLHRYGDVEDATSSEQDHQPMMTHEKSENNGDLKSKEDHTGGIAVETKIAHFASRTVGEITCPICQREQMSNRDVCSRCGCEFIYDDENNGS